MRVVIQRVSEASVKTGGTKESSIGAGLLILIGIEQADNEEDAVWLSKKIAQLRIFDDQDGVMNLDIRQCMGEILVVSQFTLHAKTRKGNRPSYIMAARPEQAIPLYNSFVSNLEQESGCTVRTGVFGAMMKVSLVNDGPVTILIDTRNKE